MKLYLDDELVEEWDLRFDRCVTSYGGGVVDWVLSVDRWTPKHGPGSTVNVQLHIDTVVLNAKARAVQVYWSEGFGNTTDLQGSGEFTAS